MKLSILWGTFAFMGLWICPTLAASPILNCERGNVVILAESGKLRLMVTDSALLNAINKSGSFFGTQEPQLSVEGVMVGNTFQAVRRNEVGDAADTLVIGRENGQFIFSINQDFAGICIPDSDGYRNCYPGGTFPRVNVNLQGCSSQGISALRQL